MHSFLSRTLRGRLLVLVLLVATSLCALAGGLIWQAYRNERAAVFRELGNTARATASLAEQRLENMEMTLQSLVALGDPETINLERLRNRAVQITKPGRRWVVVTDLAGQQLINTAAPSGAELPDAVVPQSLRETIARGATFISNVVVLPEVKKPVLFVAVGLRAQGVLRYHAALVCSPEEFADGTFIADTPPSHVISVIDRNGRIVARNHSPEKYIGQAPMPDIVDAARLGRETFARSRTLEGRDVLAAVVPVTRTGWSVAVGTPIAPLFGSARDLVLTGVLTSLAILSAATAVAWWITRAAVQDLTALMDDTRAIAEERPPGGARMVLAETRAIAASLRETAARLREELQERRAAEARLRLASEELTVANQELERKVAERTASLAELVRQMEEFTYSVSHDLRGPVRAMTGFGNAILEDHGPSLAPDARALLLRIVAASNRMGALITDLLAFSRVTQQAVALVPIELGPLVRECVGSHPVLGAHAERIRVEEPLPVVVGHASFLAQAITNLLSNAIKFVPMGAVPEVRVHAERRDGRARLWIEDNGIGIAPAQLSRLFAMFERLHTDRRFEGTGIGLAIARRAIERMGGRIGAESDGVTGSRFWIELPLAPEAAPVV